MDGFSRHDRGCIDPLGQVKCFYFPPNITSVYQTLDQGIIITLKTKYKAKVLEHLVGTANSFEQLQLLATYLPDGCAGLAYGNPPHISDAICIIKECWNSITHTAISACWKHSNCLPPFPETQPNIDYTYKTIEKETLSNMNTLMDELSHAHPNTMQSMFGLGKLIRDVQLQTWLHLEECEIFGVHNDDIEESEVEVEDNEERELSQSRQEKKVEKVSILKMILPHIHAYGVKLGDSNITNTARELCNYILYQSDNI